MGIFSDADSIAKDIDSVTKLSQTVFSNVDSKQIEQFVLEYQKLRNQDTVTSIDVAQAQASAIAPSIMNDWRNVVGWVCTGAFALNYLVFPLIDKTQTLFHITPIPTPINIVQLAGLCVTLLGAHGFTSWENKSK